MREKILVIDHAFHRKTRSSDFFLKRLSSQFDIETVFLEPPDSLKQENLEYAVGSDYILLWQMDYLAPVFLALGKRVIVAPMYDGSGSMPVLHWLFQRNARIISFSLTLHLTVAKLGLSSRYIQYFKEPVPANKRTTFDDGLRVFFWQRRPEHGLTVDVVHELLGNQMRFLHVHNVPDQLRSGRKVVSLKGGANCEVRVTEWFENHDKYLQALEGCNTFICPRVSEGIGMAMIEAMSRGMLILGVDQPTHNEYLANWINGVLFDPRNVGFASIGERAEKIGHQAWLSASIGRERWLRDVIGLMDFVRTTPQPNVLFTSIDDAYQFGEKLTHAYYSNGRYEKFLWANKPLIARVAGISEKELDLQVKVSE